MTGESPSPGEALRDRPLILVIEDEEVMRDACQEILAGEGHSVELAENGNMGIDMAARLRPDLAIVDIRMPGIDGLEVLPRIGEIDPKIVKIVITGYATIEYAIQAMKNGAYDFLPKPFTPDELRLIVNRGLEKRRLLVEMEALQEEKKQMTDFFISIVSHQLRTPLVAVKQYFEVILGDLAGEISAETRDMLKRADVRIDELIALIQDWLALARFDPRKVRSEFKMMDLAGVIKHHIEFLAPLISERRIQVQMDCCKDLPQIQGDERSIGEVVSNLLSNAIKYNRDAGRIKICVRVENERCCVRIEDTGIGISKKDLPLVFNEFFRVKNEKTMEISGTGLGLPIVKRIVEAHGGSVEVESTYGEGSAFTVYLPIGAQQGRKEMAS